MNDPNDLSRMLGLGSGAGPTGEYPDAKIGMDDGGELDYRIGVNPRLGLILIDFGTPVAWLAFPPAHARQLAASLIKKAEELDGGPKP